MSQPRVSIVIPTRGRPRPLRACLEALARAFPPDAETIVVHDGEAPGSAALSPFATPLRLTLLSIPQSGPSAARNRGLAAARGEVVAFLDDDCRPAPGWLATLAAAVSVADARAAGGTTRNGLPDNPYAATAQLVLDLVARHERETRGEETFFPSNNVAFPTLALRALGGFDPAFRTAEDRELCRRWRASGRSLARASAAVVEHDARLDLGGFVRQFFLYGRGAAAFHASGPRSSLTQSAAFHVRLPALLRPALNREPPSRALRLVALLGLWEVANLCGFLAGPHEGARRVPAPEPVSP
jgi:glycosyltransferase involved in cell wall biosynthesis